MNLPQILTQAEVTDFLGVGAPAVAAWAAAGVLPACARSESGELLFYHWRVERDGPKLAASEVVRFRKANGRRGAGMLHGGHRLPCGCVLVDDGASIGQPVWLCPDVQALQAIDRLAAAFIEAAPGDPFFRRLSSVTTQTLARHFAAAPAERGGDRLLPRSPSSSSSETACEAHVT